MPFDINKIIDNARVGLYDRLTGKRKRYEAVLRQRQAEPVYRDVMSGIYTRYFTCRSHLVRVGPVFEIDHGQYTHLTTDPLLVTISVPWKISGPLEDTVYYVNGVETPVYGVLHQNKMLIQEAAKKIPIIVAYIKDYAAYHQGNPDSEAGGVD